MADHYHHERNHQGKDNKLLFPEGSSKGRSIECHQRLGGLLKFYLGVHLKTGHTWPLQNRPTELNQDKSIYNPPTAISANIFRNPA